jgi:protein-disulfide isomerase
MRFRLLVAVVVASALALPVAAQSPAQPTAPAPAPAGASPTPGATESVDEPSLEERRIVAFVATGVSVASLATGVVMGVLAQQQFACADDIISCNGSLKDPVVGEEFFDVRAEIEQKALFADMAFLFAGASAVVATVGFLRGFVFVDEPTAAPVAALPAALPAPLPVATIARGDELVSEQPAHTAVALGAPR